LIYNLLLENDLSPIKALELAKKTKSNLKEQYKKIELLGK